MGVAGSGKTTIGRALAAELGWTFVDADEHHSRRNLEKMRAGDPLNDRDRGEWLLALQSIVGRALARREHIVLACSALKERYRALLTGDLHPVRLVFLKAPKALLYERNANNPSSLYGAELLAMQIADLEEPEEALVLDASQRPEDLLGAIRREYGI